jgi:membrane protein DedA with SNARE-associated domain
MKWGAYLGLALLSTVKFMFAPAAGPRAELSYWETYFSCVAGALLCSIVFFYGANYFMQRAQRRTAERNKKRLAAGKIPKTRKNFTRINKSVVKTKRSLGMIPICLWAPFFMSVPLGSVVVAKFYRKQRFAFPIIVFGIFINGLITTSLVYLIG